MSDARQPGTRVTPALCAAVAALLFAIAACSGNDAATQVTSDVALPPVTEAIAPGECPVPEQLAVVAIKTADMSYSPTFGVGSSDCGGATGKGYLVFGYEPILIDTDTDASVEIIVTGEVDVSIGWPGGEQFEPTSNGRWKLMQLQRECQRLTIDVTSRDGKARATYGADVRAGGQGVACLVRDASTPIDPADTAPLDTTVGPTTTVELVLPSLVEPPPITDTAG